MNYIEKLRELVKAVEVAHEIEMEYSKKTQEALKELTEFLATIPQIN